MRDGFRMTFGMKFAGRIRVRSGVALKKAFLVTAE